MPSRVNNPIHDNKALPILSIVVPIGMIQGNYEPIFDWLENEKLKDSQIILAVDLTGVNSSKGVLRKLKDKVLNISNVEVVSGNFNGPGGARNKGLELARAPWITFWDADDCPKPDTVLSQLNHHKYVSDVIVGGYKVVNYEDCPTALFEPVTESLEDVALSPGIWRILFKRDVIQEILFEEIRMGEDQVFVANVLLRTDKVYFSESVFYEYRVGVNRQLTRHPTSRLDGFQAASKLSALAISTGSSELRYLLKIMEIRTLASAIKASIYIPSKIDVSTIALLGYRSFRRPLVSSKALWAIFSQNRLLVRK